MSNLAGRTLGQFSIVDELGAGGMGRVYRALDSRLERQVALKVLPDDFAEDPDRLARFEREARVLASLNHPNIATLHGLEEHEGRHILVMELVEGDDLAQRVARGPIPLNETIPIVRQIAEALEAAHSSGIVHRDLKPANVKLRPDGAAKVLDFGLAKAWQPAGSAPDLTRSPTETAHGTAAGVILGTAPYMSPEQARGQPIDRRTDVWAFGCLLYEMLTGRQLFSGGTVSDVLAGVLKGDIDLDALPPETPRSMRRLLRRCLQRDPARRLRDLGDAILELDEPDEPPPGPEPARRPSLTSRTAWVAAGVATIVAAALAWQLQRTSGNRPVVISEIAPPAGAEFVFHSDVGSPPVIAPDGSAVIFGAAAHGEAVTLWVRSLRTGETRQLPGTEGGFSPFWSPDAGSIAFFDFSDLKRLDLDGETPLDLCPSGIGRGGVWATDDTIVFAPDYNTGLHRVSATGGDPVPITSPTPGRHTSHRWPTLLPDGKHVVYLAINHAAPQSRDNGLHIVGLDGSDDQPLVTSVANAAASGDDLLFLRDRTLMAQRLAANRGVLTGEPRIVAREVFYETDTWRGAFSAGGDLLVYQPSPRDAGARIDLVDLEGRELGTLGDIDTYWDLSASPDGGRLAVSVGAPSVIWVFDLESGLRTRLTFETGPASSPVWSPDGTEIYYRVFDAKNPSRILVKPASGAGEPRTVLEEGEHLFIPAGLSPDGRYLILDNAFYVAGSDIWIMDVVQQSRPRKLIERPGTQTQPLISPDGRWLAYSSNETGVQRVYVEPFIPEAVGDAAARRSGRWQMSEGDGVVPVWSADGRTLVYLSFDGRLVAVDIDATGDSLRIGASRTVNRTTASTSYRSVDLIPGTDRLIVINQRAQTQTPLTLVTGIGRQLAGSTK